MKKIVLIGDSIRLGYDKYIKDAFDGVCSVFSSDENGKFAVNVLRFAHEWKSLGKWGDDVDVVHWNAGLWDVLHLYGDKAMTPIDCYADYIKRIDKHLRVLFPQAKMIFATSTAVLEQNYGKLFCRFNSEIVELLHNKKLAKKILLPKRKRLSRELFLSLEKLNSVMIHIPLTARVVSKA